MGQEESELNSGKEHEGSLTLTVYQNQQGRLSPLSASGKNLLFEVTVFNRIFFSFEGRIRL